MKLPWCHRSVAVVLLVALLCQLTATAMVHPQTGAGHEAEFAAADNIHHGVNHGAELGAVSLEHTQPLLCCDQGCDYQGDCALMHVVMVSAEGRPDMALAVPSFFVAREPAGFPVHAVDRLLRPPINT